MILKRKKGFTLIELLVVIAIIAILAAILFPVFARAREKARTASCLSNQKEICLGFKMYTNDYDEKFPGGGAWVGCSCGGVCYADKIYSYVKNAQIYHCPSDSNLPAGNLGDASLCSYGYNTNVADVSEAQCEAVASTILTGDAVSYTDFRQITVYNDGDLDADRHSDGANYSFLDGHGKWVRQTQISTSFDTSKACFQYQ